MIFILARARRALGQLGHLGGRLGGRLTGCQPGRPRGPRLGADVTCLWDADATLGENPRWDAVTGSVYWVDIPAGRLHRYRLADGARATWTLGTEIGAIAVAPDGRVAVTLGDALCWFDPVAGALAPWCTLPDLDVARCRLNDGDWCPDGSLWLTSMDREGRAPLGRLHRVGRDGAAAVLADGFTIANGPAFDARRGVAYVADSPARTILALPLDAPGARREFARLAPNDGHPDGMAVMADGHLLVAHHDGGCVSRWTPDGRCLGRIPLPFARACAVALVPRDAAPYDLVVTSGRDAGRGGGLYALALR